MLRRIAIIAASVVVLAVPASAQAAHYRQSDDGNVLVGGTTRTDAVRVARERRVDARIRAKREAALRAAARAEIRRAAARLRQRRAEEKRTERVNGALVRSHRHHRYHRHH